MATIRRRPYLHGIVPQSFGTTLESQKDLASAIRALIRTPAQIANKKPPNKKSRGEAPATQDLLARGRPEAGISSNKHNFAPVRRRSRKTIKKFRSGSGPTSRNKKSAGGGLGKVIP